MVRMNKQQLERQARLLEIVEKLHYLGLTWEEAEKFPFVAPRIYSNYSMGEKIEWTLNGDYIYTEQYTDEYSKSCTWKAKHGYILINFKTKKRLKEFAQKAIAGSLTREDIEQVIDFKLSIIKDGKFSHTKKTQIVEENNHIL